MRIDDKDLRHVLVSLSVCEVCKAPTADQCFPCVRILFSPLSGLDAFIGDMIQGRRARSASRLPLAVIFRAFGAAPRAVRERGGCWLQI